MATSSKPDTRTNSSVYNGRFGAPRFSIQELETMAREIRRDALKTILDAGSGHPGGSLSEMEILISLYFGVMRHDPRTLIGRTGTG